MGQLVPITRKTSLNIAICPRVISDAVNAETLMTMSKAMDDFDEFPDLFLDSFETLADLFDQKSLKMMQCLKSRGPMTATQLGDRLVIDEEIIDEKLASLTRVGCVEHVVRDGQPYFYTYFESVKLVGNLSFTE